ncbi:hypothetical protein GH714_039626 [Hevea brasiliensis]|uniref:RING-type E3 ubiquitin transferase n=1 Tax=Hevea brasiliensis TaxID=3981 RepID=A0A6A6N0R9_HEVBR|nr:hypothetical protein GH714_039626 [Hevea brasiliensis]
MVLLLGAVPEYGILVYEYMAKGSLDDRLFRRGDTPVLPWQLRFRIAAEIATGLLFLHQTKPEPLVHRDLKPGNILLDHNVCKISDVGLARLVPAVAENVTQYHMTSTAGTFCYIDPEYQQTGMLGVKSDVYSLGIMLLQIITARPPMGLTHIVEQAIENGAFKEILDPAVPDWPIEEALTFAKLALQCAELRRKDRPDLGKVALPELDKLRSFAQANMNNMYWAESAGPSPHHSYISTTQAKSRQRKVHSPDDVQRLCVVLRPESGERSIEQKQDPHSGKEGVKRTSTSTTTSGKEGGHVNIQEEPLLRFIVMGRKSLPDPKEYDTSTRGHRHKYPARTVGEGVYRILRHNPGKRMHTHLVYRLEFPPEDKENEPQESLNIERQASFIIQIKNPEQRAGSSYQFRGLENKRKRPCFLQTCKANLATKGSFRLISRTC